MKPCSCTAREQCINSRPRDGYRIRRYICPECHTRWSTVETPYAGRHGYAALSELEADIRKRVKAELIAKLNAL